MATELIIFENEKELSLEEDEETRNVVNVARDAYYEAVKIFPNTDKEAFLSAFLAGYLKGVQKGQEMFSELKISVEHASEYSTRVKP